MTLRRIGFLAFVVAAAGSAFAQENTLGPSSVETAMKEIQGLLETATADLKDYHQISLERTFLSPIPNSANGDKVTTETLKQRFDYYRGEGDTYRVEISAGRKSVEGADPSTDAITIDPAIRYRDSDGAEFLRIFHRRLMTNGDAAELVVWRPQSPRVGITSAFVHNDFNPQFVYNKSGIQWTDLFRGILPACDTVSRAESNHDLTYVFGGKNEGSNSEFKYTITFRDYGGRKLLRHFSESGRGDYEGSQDWEYLEQNGRWLPRQSTEIIGTSDPAIHKTQIIAYQFGNGGPLLTAQQLVADKPLNPETAKQIEDAMQLDLETVAREKGI
ncbi:MAG TPA: hypothetical protein PK988_12035, partial [Candidatus Sumerlaeota bacterium]|nr:hypothetical protein [Candidatus Sumerlaeota bacterium]